MHKKCIAKPGWFLNLVENNRIIIATKSKHEIPIKIIVLKQIKHYPAHVLSSPL